MDERVIVAVEPDSELAINLMKNYPEVAFVFDTENYGMVAINTGGLDG